MKLWRGSDGKWYEAACPGGGVEYVARKAAEDAAREAALAAAEKAVAEACEFCRYGKKELPGRRDYCRSEHCQWLKIIEALAQLRAAKGAE